MRCITSAGESRRPSNASSTVLTMRTFPQFFQVFTLQSSFVGATVAGTSICAINLIQCLILVAAEKMTLKELEIRNGKNIFQTGAASVGAAISAAVGVSLAYFGWNPEGQKLNASHTRIGFQLSVNPGNVRSVNAHICILAVSKPARETGSLGHEGGVVVAGF